LIPGIIIFNKFGGILRVLVAGGGGLAGSAIIRNSPNSAEIFSPAKSELDLSKHDEVKDYLFENRIEAIFLAAAKVGGILANSIDQWDFLLDNLQIQNAVISSAKELRIQNLIF
jgi:GDP-L-fucose synthase